MEIERNESVKDALANGSKNLLPALSRLHPHVLWVWDDGLRWHITEGVHMQDVEGCCKDMTDNDQLEEIIAGIEVFLRFLSDIRTIYEVPQLVHCPMLAYRSLAIEVLPNNLDCTKVIACISWDLCNFGSLLL